MWMALGRLENKMDAFIIFINVMIFCNYVDELRLTHVVRAYVITYISQQ